MLQGFPRDGGAAPGLIRVGLDAVGVDRGPRHRKVYPGDSVPADAAHPPSISTTRQLPAGHPIAIIENVPPDPARLRARRSALH